MSAGSLGWVEAVEKIQVFSAAGGGVLLPAPSPEITAPQDAKLSALTPEPSEHPYIMERTFESDTKTKGQEPVVRR